MLNNTADNEMLFKTCRVSSSRDKHEIQYHRVLILLLSRLHQNVDKMYTPVDTVAEKRQIDNVDMLFS